MRNLFGYLLFLFSLPCFAQLDTNVISNEKVVALKLHYGTIYIHTQSVKNVAGARPYGVELELAKLDIDTAAYNKCNCYPRYGIALSYVDFDKAILGHGEMISYFLEPAYRISNKFKFNLRGAAGLIYASNPFNKIKNPVNKSYTTHINPYLQFGVGLSYNVTSHLSMAIIGSFQHFSNGGFKQPNRGVNWITGSVGFLYYSQNNNLPKYKSSSYKNWHNKKTDFDAGFMYVPKQGYNSKIMGQRKFLAGAFGQATKQYGRISALTGGVEIYYDKIEAATINTNKRSALQAGIHAGHTFLFNRVSFSQQIGVQIIKENSDAGNFYFRYGLSYRFTRHLIAGINLKTHYDNADFSDLRIIYRL